MYAAEGVLKIKTLSAIVHLPWNSSYVYKEIWLAHIFSLGQSFPYFLLSMNFIHLWSTKFVHHIWRPSDSKYHWTYDKKSHYLFLHILNRIHVNNEGKRDSLWSQLLNTTLMVPLKPNSYSESKEWCKEYLHSQEDWIQALALLCSCYSSQKAAQHTSPLPWKRKNSICFLVLSKF